MPSDHWYAEVFRALPVLVCHLLPRLAPGPHDSDRAYMVRPMALKKLAHHPDGVLWDRVLWPRDHPGGSRELPEVLHEEVEPLRHGLLVGWHERECAGRSWEASGGLCGGREPGSRGLPGSVRG